MSCIHSPGMRFSGIASVVVVATAFSASCGQGNVPQSQAVQNQQTIQPQSAAAKRVAAAVTVSISPDKPFDMPAPADGAQNTLTDAAVFAWQQFIAHTWPAKPQRGEMNSRDEPDVTRRYGQKGETGQVVWETFRHKSEVFPGKGVLPMDSWMTDRSIMGTTRYRCIRTTLVSCRRQPDKPVEPHHLTISTR